MAGGYSFGSPEGLTAVSVTILVILVVSASLVFGAAWGIYGPLPAQLEGFIVAFAGGALVVSAVLELINPAADVAPLWALALSVLGGAATFTGLDKLVKKRSSAEGR